MKPGVFFFIMESGRVIIISSRCFNVNVSYFDKLKTDIKLVCFVETLGM